ncbi:RICIN domain-containing protein [Actinoplanes xinjiangensis]|uniref:RICIN domain-containing protein n=1 Tax=Actinoplanes xinjiangensis TaxID=512350 RepID=UPI0034383FA6
MRKHLLAHAVVASGLLTSAFWTTPARAGTDFDMIINQQSRTCLTDAGRPDHRATQATCDPADRRQQWDFDGEHEDQRFVNAATKRCLTVFGDADGQPVYVAACNLAGVSNHWTWVWTEEEEDVFELQPIDVRGFCLDLRAHDAVGLWECDDEGAANQRWDFQSV